MGELVITQSMLSDLGSRFEMSQLPVLLERVAQLERNTREIQERVMGIPDGADRQCLQSVPSPRPTCPESPARKFN
ncbi:MAG: hypothetical protein MRJ92_05995 [Nitrospira sp.]|nr:hypothetical protein [Nitrospira sp.]